MHVVKERHISISSKDELDVLNVGDPGLLSGLSRVLGVGGPGWAWSLPQSQDSDKALARSGPGPANERPVWPDLTNERRGV